MSVDISNATKLLPAKTFTATGYPDANSNAATKSIQFGFDFCAHQPRPREVLQIQKMSGQVLRVLVSDFYVAVTDPTPICN